MTKAKKNTSTKPQTVWTLDTETRGLFGKIFRIGLYNGNQYWHFDDMQECYDLLKLYAKEEEIHIYIHNLDFDLSKMAGTIAKDIDFNRCVFIDRNVAVFGTKDIILHDSLKLIPGTLERICKDFGLGSASKIDLTDHILSLGWAVDKDGNPTTDKKKVDKNKSLGVYFNLVSPDEPMLNEYLEFDCTSLHNVIMQLIKISELTMEEFLKCPTTASLAMKVFKENYPDDYADVTSSNFRGEFGQLIEEVLRQGYYGGRTEVYQPYLEGGFHYDVNSLYPYVMKVNEFPIGYYDVYQTERANDCYQEWKYSGQGGGFAWVKVFVPDTLNIPPLPYRAKKDKNLKGKLIFPTGKLDGVWAFPELAMAEKYGCIIEKVEQVVFFKKTYPVFKEFVEQFELLKRTSKGAKRTFAKLVQNALYGKFGMRRKRRTIKPMSELSKVIEEGKVYTEFEHAELDLEMLQVEELVQAQYIQPHIAGYVTAYARCLLYEGLMNKNNGQVAYCDTDSIACENQFAESDIHEDEYGKWKLENVIDYGIFLQPKLYFEKSNIEKAEKEFPELVDDLKKNPLTIKAKGIPGNIKSQFTEETYNLIFKLIKSGKEKVMFFGTPDSLFDKKVNKRGKFVSMLLNGMDFDTEIAIQKGMNLRAKQKRNIDYKNNFSTPHNIKNYGD